MINRLSLMGLFGTLVIIGTFVLLILGAINGKLDYKDILILCGSWVGTILGAFFYRQAVDTITRGKNKE